MKLLADVPASAPAGVITKHARQRAWAIVTQDLDAAARLSRIEHINEVLHRVLADLEPLLHAGTIVCARAPAAPTSRTLSKSGCGS
jgi:hypothetical protein